MNESCRSNLEMLAHLKIRKPATVRSGTRERVDHLVKMII